MSGAQGAGAQGCPPPKWRWNAFIGIVAASVAFCTSGCAFSGNLQTLDDGSYQVDCSGGYHDWSACNEAARRACRGGGVEILSQVSNEASQGVGTRDWSAAGSEVSRSMNFRCR